MAKTSIEWCDYTINPVVGCSKCSPACLNCYAEKFAQRFSKHSNSRIAAKYAGVVGKTGWTGRISKLDMGCFDRASEKAKPYFRRKHDGLFP